jgi:hypothetical protein
MIEQRQQPAKSLQLNDFVSSINFVASKIKILTNTLSTKFIGQKRVFLPLMNIKEKKQFDFRHDSERRLSADFHG